MPQNPEDLLFWQLQREASQKGGYGMPGGPYSKSGSGGGGPQPYVRRQKQRQQGTKAQAAPEQPNFGDRMLQAAPAALTAGLVSAIPAVGPFLAPLAGGAAAAATPPLGPPSLGLSGDDYGLGGVKRRQDAVDLEFNRMLREMGIGGFGQ